VHVGSQGYELSQLAEGVRRIAVLRQEIAGKTGRLITHVDVGGGMSTVYDSGAAPAPPRAYRKLLKKRSPDLFAEDVRLVTEFGRSIQANCGLAVSRVECVKSAQRLAVIHLGADFLLRPVYRATDWKHESFVLDPQGRPKTAALTPTTIAGPLCFGGDIVGRGLHLPPLEPGDWIVIRDVGAYTLSLWSRHCSRAIPSVIGYDPQQAAQFRVLRRGETPADVVRFWSSGV
jgi:diaminopimelate decarboxylase